MDSGPHGRKGGQDMKSYLSPQLGLGYLFGHSRVETPEDSVFPEVGPDLRDTGQGRAGQVEGLKSFQKQAQQPLF